MKKLFDLPARSALLLFAVTMLFFIQPCCAATQEPSIAFDTPYKTSTDWPGVLLRIVDVERIFNNRLMVVVRIEGTKNTPAEGTLIGSPAVTETITHPYSTQPDVRTRGPFPYAVAAARMTDELSGKSYPQLPNAAPPGLAYFPSVAGGKIYPNRTMIISLQFAVPPPPPPPEPGQPAPPQTLSFLFPKAKGPIVHVPLPPPVAASATAP